MIQRNLDAALRIALADTRVVLMNGARQTGKSTLAREIAADLGGRYLSLDDDTVLHTARSDPAALVRGEVALTVIDEVQKAPQLFPTIKVEVDRSPRPGRFLLTGSADVFLLPDLSESLAGRMEILSLRPFSQDEQAGQRADFPQAAFGNGEWTTRRQRIDRAAIGARIVKGGFPEVVGRPESQRRGAWFRSYVSSVVQRDIREMGGIEGLTDMPRLLSLLAARASSLMNMSEISRAAGIPHSTLRRYLGLLEATFLLQPLPAWSTNLGKRLVKAPKIHLIDSGLTAHLRGESDPAALIQSPSIGPLLETFVLQEIRAQLAWSQVTATIYHFRTSAGREVDLVLEAPGGRVVGIEVKAAGSLGASDVLGLEALREAAGKKFVRGIVLYLGDQVVPLGDRLIAVPMEDLWAAGHLPVKTGRSKRTSET